MSRPAAAAPQKPEPTIRRARFAEEDLVSTFGEGMLAEARRLLRAGAVNLAAAGPTIEATIAADGEHHCVAVTPTQRGARVAFPGTCEPTPFPKLGGLRSLPLARPPASIARRRPWQL